MKRRKNQQRDVILIFGQSGEGKSELLNQLLYDYNKVIIVDQFGELDAELYTDDPARVLRHCKGSPFYRVVFTNLDRINELCSVVTQLHDLVFAVDEVQNIYEWKGRNVEPSATDIIFSGRHYGCSLVITTVSPMIVPISFRRQQKRVITFRLTEQADLKWLKSVCPRPDLIDELRFFPQRKYLDIRRDGTVEVNHT